MCFVSSPSLLNIANFLSISSVTKRINNLVTIDDRFSLRHCPPLFSIWHPKDQEYCTCLHCYFHFEIRHPKDQEYCTCPQQVDDIFCFIFSSPSTIVFRCAIAPHRLSLRHCLFKQYCTCPQQVSFFFTWFLTKVLKCVEIIFVDFFCFIFSWHDF